MVLKIWLLIELLKPIIKKNNSHVKLGIIPKDENDWKDFLNFIKNNEIKIDTFKIKMSNESKEIHQLLCNVIIQDISIGENLECVVY